MADGFVLADSHVHLDRYPEEAVRDMLQRAAAVGVEHLLTVGIDLASSRAALRLASRHQVVRAAVGVHPTRVSELADPRATLQELARLAGADLVSSTPTRVVAIGEVGLDEQAGADTLAAQERFFAGCLELAAATGLPLVLHVVGAHAAALALLRPRAPVRAVVHYFVGDATLAERYLELGCSISIGKPVTRASEAALRAAATTIPLERLLLETDTYPLPGRATEPRDVSLVCATIAALRDLTPHQVAASTTENFLRLFN